MTDDRLLGSDAARAVGRFDPDGPHGYRARSGGPLRATRAEAEADERRNLDGTAYCTCEQPVMDVEHDAGCRRCGLPVHFAATLDLDARYRVAGWGGVAWRVLGYVKVRDEDYEWTGLEEDDTSRVRAVMVGDDTVHEHDVTDLEPLNDNDYCPECGQIGCKAYQAEEE